MNFLLEAASAPAVCADKIDDNCVALRRKMTPVRGCVTGLANTIRAFQSKARGSRKKYLATKLTIHLLHILADHAKVTGC